MIIATMHSPSFLSSLRSRTRIQCDAQNSHNDMSAYPAAYRLLYLVNNFQHSFSLFIEITILKRFICYSNVCERASVVCKFASINI